MSKPAISRLIGAVLLLTGAALLVTWYLQSRAPHGPRNIVLVTLDTTRPDALGVYSKTGALTPVLNQWAAQGQVFDQAYSHAPITLPSHSSILTGLTPPQHGVRNNIAYSLDASHRSLPALLKAQGYATAAFVSSIILDSRFGLDQGFDVYDDNIVHYAPKTEKAIVTRRASTTLDAALAWLNQHQTQSPEQPFFSWIHLYDAHSPYDPPLPFKQAYADAPYHGEVAYMDQQLGRLAQFLSEQGLASDTLVIVTADHGESFGEHGESTHGFFCYSATTHVPLILSLPLYGQPGKRYEYRVQSIDLVPSILGALGMEVPPELQGRMLNDPQPRAVFSEAIIPQEDFYLAPVHSLKDARYAFYYSSDLELYDLEQDPGETHNLALAEPDLTQRYVDKMEQLLDTAGASKPASGRVAVDQATIDMLRSLGYIADGGSANAAHGDPFALPSPLKSVGIYRRLQTLRQMEDVYPFKMIDGLRLLVKEDAKQIILHRELGRLLVLGGNEAEGIEHLRNAVDLQPADPRLHTFLGLGYHQFGRFDDSVREYEVALELNPEHTIARYNLGLAQLATGDVERARSSFETVIRQNPSDILALNNLAFIVFRHDGDTAKAVELMQQAAAINPDHPLIKANLQRYLNAAAGGEDEEAE